MQRPWPTREGVPKDVVQVHVTFTASPATMFRALRYTGILTLIALVCSYASGYVAEPGGQLLRALEAVPHIVLLLIMLRTVDYVFPSVREWSQSLRRQQLTPAPAAGGCSPAVEDGSSSKHSRHTGR